MFARVKRSGTSLLLMLSAFSCRGVTASMEDLACDRGRCQHGYECRTDTKICVPALTRACDGSGVCWTDVNTGDDCGPNGAFVPCSAATDCGAGCRTCEMGMWSACAGGCDLGALEDCASCGDDCSKSVLNAGALCLERACGYDLCATDFVDLDGLTQNGCECGPTRAEICDGADNDCDGRTDDLSPAEVNNQCNTRFPGARVDVWRCDGGCAIVTCAPGTANADGLVPNGCESGCSPTHGGVETCDGVDNDCNLETDDGIADINADCMARVPTATGVGRWRCDPVDACAIDACATDFYDFDGDVSTGCEVFCQQTNAGQEACDDIDNDCDGTTDEGVDLANCETFYRDEDGDTIGRPRDAQCLCNPVGVYSSTIPGDCTDNNTNVNQVDCDLYYRDEDADGRGRTDDNHCWCAPGGVYTATTGGDCDDDPAACGALCSPDIATDPCDGHDNDCDGSTDPGCASLFALLDSSSANLVNNGVTALALRADGALAVGTSTTGAVSFLPNAASTFVDVTGLKAAPITTIIAAGDDFWIGYHEDACDTDDGCGPGSGVRPQCGPERVTQTPYTVTLACTDAMSTTNNGAWSLAYDPGSGDIYIGTNDDHSIYKASLSAVDCDIGGTSEERLSVAVVDGDAPGHLWFGTATRLYECIPDHTGPGTCDDACSARDAAFDAARDDISALAFDDGGTPGNTGDDALWVGSFSHGLSLYRIRDDSRQTGWTQQGGLPSNRVQALAVAHGAGGPRLFIGTDAGLAVLDIAFGDLTVYDTSTPDALPSNDITALAVDVTRGRLWIGTPAGVVRAEPLP